MDKKIKPEPMPHLQRKQWSTMRRTHEAQQVHASYAGRDELPDITPIVGDHIRYLTAIGIEIWPINALSTMRRGEVVMYETYEDPQFAGEGVLDRMMRGL